MGEFIFFWTSQNIWTLKSEAKTVEVVTNKWTWQWLPLRPIVYWITTDLYQVRIPPFFIQGIFNEIDALLWISLTERFKKIQNWVLFLYDFQDIVQTKQFLTEYFTGQVPFHVIVKSNFLHFFQTNLKTRANSFFIFPIILKP